MSSLPTYPNVLLSIDPEQADAILDASKQYEYRRTLPACETPIRFVLYANAPVQAAVGVFWSFWILRNQPAILVAETIDRTPNDAGDVLEYLDGADDPGAIRVSTFRRFENPVSRARLEADGFDPAQNFRYLPDVPAAEAGEDSYLITADEQRRTVIET